jgi:hypothetical protein
MTVLLSCYFKVRRRMTHNEQVFAMWRQSEFRQPNYPLTAKLKN